MREGAYVYTKEGTRVPSLTTGGLVRTVLDEQNMGRRKMFITRANSAS
jgi:hypothetical protein